MGKVDTYNAIQKVVGHRSAVSTGVYTYEKACVIN